MHNLLTTMLVILTSAFFNLIKNDFNIYFKAVNP